VLATTASATVSPTELPWLPGGLITGGVRSPIVQVKVTLPVLLPSLAVTVT
jgi:hypothetical protein